MDLNIKLFLKIVGLLSLIEGLAMFPCIFFAIHYSENTSLRAFAIFSSIYIAFGLIIFITLKSYKPIIKIREGYIIACISWLFCSFIGTFPIYFSGMDYSLVNSFFEAIAGFTTTGCTVLDMDLMPKSIILWRAIMNWIGGMGILVLVVSIFPALGISGQSIAQIETTGPTLEKVNGKISATGLFLYQTYFFFTILEFILLALGPLGKFDALINTFGSISTGGLFVTTENEEEITSTYSKIIIFIFTFLSSLNYTLYYSIIKGNIKAALKNYELKIFTIIILVSSLAISINLYFSSSYNNMLHAIRDSLSQVISFISTSGYYVVDFTRWPIFANTILFSLLFVGGCSMSTSGSLKVIRISVLVKLIYRGILKMIHPNQVKAVVINGKAIPAKTVSDITSHIMLYFLVFIIGSVLLAFDGQSLDTTITTALGLFTNTGLALSPTGIHGFFGYYSDFSTLVMCILMLAGRLEMYSVLLLFTKNFWASDNTN